MNDKPTEQPKEQPKNPARRRFLKAGALTAVGAAGLGGSTFLWKKDQAAKKAIAAFERELELNKTLQKKLEEYSAIYIQFGGTVDGGHEYGHYDGAPRYEHGTLVTPLTTGPHHAYGQEDHLYAIKQRPPVGDFLHAGKELREKLDPTPLKDTVEATIHPSVTGYRMAYTFIGAEESGIALGLGEKGLYAKNEEGDMIPLEYSCAVIYPKSQCKSITLRLETPLLNEDEVTPPTKTAYSTITPITDILKIDFRNLKSSELGTALHAVDLNASAFLYHYASAQIKEMGKDAFTDYLINSSPWTGDLSPTIRFKVDDLPPLTFQQDEEFCGVFMMMDEETLQGNDRKKYQHNMKKIHAWVDDVFKAIEQAEKSDPGHQRRLLNESLSPNAPDGARAK